jgi:cell wall-associated NlpC family hydrolase
MFLDTPYLWGGRTLMGVDCSGFTQLIYKMAGKQLPRDAYQQAEVGELIAFIDEAQTGDLAFFDNAEGKITHVGIVINQQKSGEKTIIHASGKVRMDRLDHQGIYNIELGAYSHQLRFIRRLS